jgi:predicted nucleotidyltransferase
MSELDKVRNKINAKKSSLRKKYHLKSIGIFGSYVHGKQNKKSDLDVLVEFSRPVGFIAFMRLSQELSDCTGITVDLVTRKALKPRIGERILQEVVLV